MIIRKLLETHDTTSTAKFRHLVEAMDEEEISFHEQTKQNLVIEWPVKVRKKKLQRHHTTSERAEGDRTEETRADNGRRKRRKSVL
jgi:hypothetical protein